MLKVLTLFPGWMVKFKTGRLQSIKEIAKGKVSDVAQSFPY